jgi:hypothetical protein
MTELDLYQEAQMREYGVYTATRQIFIGGALAFNPGDPVPVSHVERGIVAVEDVTKEPLPESEVAVRYVPFGADAEPDPADVRAAAKANAGAADAPVATSDKGK